MHRKKRSIVLVWHRCVADIFPKFVANVEFSATAAGLPEHYRLGSNSCRPKDTEA